MFCLPMSTVAAFKLDPNLHHKPPPSPPLPSSEAKATAKASILDANSNNNNNNNNQIRLIDRKILEHTFGQSIRTANETHFQTESANKLHEPTRRVLPNLPSSIRASDIPLVVISEPANNDTERLLTFVCEWITANNPIIVLSLLDKERNFFASQATLSAGIPLVSLTQSYRNEISTIADDHQVELILTLGKLSINL
ncbi:hypothetical protein BLOT_000802 [Blomia tropicalis]|nr:hypothetical protein BLOT_000802 [Blomia tropicalis]